MLIGEPLPSEYDWRFTLFGFPVRVTWLFWVVAAALGYQSALVMTYVTQGFDVPGSLSAMLCIWVIAAFVSIFVHELGHGIAFRYFGIQAQIVLYHMGGLAIPGAGLLWSRKGFKTRLTHLDNIIISAAGPAIQLLLAVVVALIATAAGIYVVEVSWIAHLFGLQMKTTLPSSAPVLAIVTFLVDVSVWWALINLVPIYPLDGGQIMRHLVGMVRRTDGLYEANGVSVIVAFALAYLNYTRGGSPINSLFLVSLGISNLQSLQSQNGPRMW